MLKTIRDMLVGAVVSAVMAAGIAYATIGQPPLQYGNQSTIDQSWLYALSGGQNFTYQYGLTAHAGGGQTACLVLAAGNFLQQVSTVASGSDSVCLPYALQGESIMVANAAASNTLDIYAQSTTNNATASTDTINGSSNSSAYTVSANTNAICFAPKNGIWNCIKGS